MPWLSAFGAGAAGFASIGLADFKGRVVNPFHHVIAGEHADGSVPIFQPPVFAQASSQLGHLLFQQRDPLF
jgi:hypothetical protein